MALIPYVTFNGNCEEAFQFYAEVMGGQVASLFKYRGSPMEEQVPEAAKDMVMHGTVMLGKNALMGCDAFAGYAAPTGMSVSYDVKTATEAERVFKALSAGATITLPLQQTFWAPRFGMLTDRFGIPWMISCESAG